MRVAYESHCLDLAKKPSALFFAKQVAKFLIKTMPARSSHHIDRDHFCYPYAARGNSGPVASERYDCFRFVANRARLASTLEVTRTLVDGTQLYLAKAYARSLAPRAPVR